MEIWPPVRRNKDLSERLQSATTYLFREWIIRHVRQRMRWLVQKLRMDTWTWQWRWKLYSLTMSVRSMSPIVTTAWQFTCTTEHRCCLNYCKLKQNSRANTVMDYIVCKWILFQFMAYGLCHITGPWPVDNISHTLHLKFECSRPNRISLRWDSQQIKIQKRGQYKCT